MRATDGGDGSGMEVLTNTHSAGVWPLSHTVASCPSRFWSIKVYWKYPAARLCFADECEFEKTLDRRDFCATHSKSIYLDVGLLSLLCVIEVTVIR